MVLQIGTDSILFEVDASEGIGVCTSSGRVGPSLSFGKADAVVAIADRAALADAAATAIANRIHTPDDIARLMDEAAAGGRLHGLLACCGDRLGVWGEIALVDRTRPVTELNASGNLSHEEGTIS